MIALNNGKHCLVYSPDRIDIQPALTGMEQSILREIRSATCGQSISALANRLNASYANTYAMVYRLNYRGLVAMKRNGSGLMLTPLADWIDSNE